MPLSQREMIAEGRRPSENPIAEVDNRSITEKCSDIERQISDLQAALRVTGEVIGELRCMFERQFEPARNMTRESYAQSQTMQNQRIRWEVSPSQLPPNPFPNNNPFTGNSF